MKKVLKIFLALTLALSLCGCSWIDRFLEVEEKVTLTPATPHAVADYTTEPLYFWDTFQIGTVNGDVVFCFTGWENLAEYNMQITGLNVGEEGIELTAVGTVEGSGDRKETCKLKLTYDPKLKYSSITEESYKELWGEKLTYTEEDKNASYTLVLAGNGLNGICNVGNGGSLIAEITLTYQASGKEKTYNLSSNEDMKATAKQIVTAILGDNLEIKLNPTDDEKYELIPSKLCFWTEELALMFPCETLLQVKDGELIWTCTENGEKVTYRLMRDFAETLPENEVAPPLSAEATYLVEKEIADKEMAEKYGTPIVPYRNFYIFYDSITKQVYRLYID